MYNVKGPSKIVAKTTRRGISQNMDNIREYTRNKSVESEDNEVATASKPVFHNKKLAQQHRQEMEVISPQHEEIIKFIKDSWNKVCSEVCQDPDGCPNPKSDQSIYYVDRPLILEGFKPFDVELWWGQRYIARITGAANGKN
ncbi:FAM195 domain containing protein [Asbolus verrucosus]|uniref:FAM195 domain containing protein n=1 Tax=Asbolus verrucosus TaxID=1661398 RepID=A0A482VBC0_ASBVE|nr:FAM195 domain containing protein [Asbolus verrucosus]